MSFIVLGCVSACATAHYTPLASVDDEDIVQLKEYIYRVTYTVSPFTSQETLDDYFLRRAAELTLREGYDYFRLFARSDVLSLSKRTAMTVVMFRGAKPAESGLYDAREVVRESERALRAPREMTLIDGAAGLTNHDRHSARYRLN